MDKMCEVISVVQIILSYLHMEMYELAKASGVPLQMLSKFHRTGDICLQHLSTLAQYLGITMDDIMHTRLPVIRKACEGLAKTSLSNQRMARSQVNRAAVARGEYGEEYVVKLEKEKLAGTDYAEEVCSDYSQSRSGFDVLSFDRETGEPIMIEVKTTQYGPGRQFIMTKYELETMKKCAEKGLRYELHFVFYANDPERCGRNIYTWADLETQFEMEPAAYTLRRRYN